MIKRYIVVIEKAQNNYSGYSPDVLGCIATGGTVEETLQNFKKALEFHLEGTVDAGQEIPHPQGLKHHLDKDANLFEDDALIAQIEARIPDEAIARIGY